MALNKSKIKKSLFADDLPAKVIDSPVLPVKSKKKQSNQAKFLDYDVTLTVRISDDQLDAVDKMVKKIMKNRTVKTERITKNTVFRCLIDMLTSMPLDLENIPDEDELRRRMLSAIGM